MMSLGRFAGGVRLNEGKQVLAISLEKIVAINRDFEMIFTHELFHVYHKKMSPRMQNDTRRSEDILMAGMFIEGLATFAEGKLNPDKYHRRMVKLLVDWCDKGFYKSYLEEFLADNKLLSYKNFEKHKDLYRKWFYSKRNKSYPFPTEAAYCIGDKVVTKLSTKFSMAEMASWSLPKILSESKATLKELMSLK